MEFVRAKLAQLATGLPAEQVEWYARFSDGSLGAALRNSEHELFDTNLRVVEGLTALTRPGDRYKPEQWTEESKSLGGRYRKLDAEISDSEAGRRGLKTIFHMAATCFADIFRLRSDSEVALVNVVNEPRIARLAEFLDAERTADAISRIARAEQQLDLNVNTQLVVETLLNDLASLTLSHRALNL